MRCACAAPLSSSCEVLDEVLNVVALKLELVVVDCWQWETQGCVDVGQRWGDGGSTGGNENKYPNINYENARTRNT